MNRDGETVAALRGIARCISSVNGAADLLRYEFVWWPETWRAFSLDRVGNRGLQGASFMLGMTVAVTVACGRGLVLLRYRRR